MLDEKVDERLLEIKNYVGYFKFEMGGLYLNFLLEPHNTVKLRKELLKFYRSSMKYLKLEKDILNIIKICIPSDRNLKICEAAIKDIDEFHFKFFNYNEWILERYTEALKTKDYSSVKIEEKKFEVLNENSKKVLIKRLCEFGEKNV